ncbi:MAG TPA: FGGY-family carbohydrate kinase [Candidatus Hydrogenedentes bacterium]|nr:FGGY-family carbohydrate kinase [Candidatus Hydrogenedentota bacterium]
MNQHETESSPLILAIDAGTQSIRAALIDLNGVVRKLVKTPIQPYFSERPGWAEQRPEYFWDMLVQTCRKLWEDAEAFKADIQGVTLTTQRGTLINLDRNGQPLRPAIVWLDQRKADPGKVIPGMGLPFLKKIKYLGLLVEITENCEANWLRQHQPEVWEKTDKFLYLSGYLTYRLTGEFTDSSANIVGYMPINIKIGKWSGNFDLKTHLFPIEKDKLPKLVEPTELLGHISSKASEETGIPEGLPLVAAANDKACEILGAGCLTPDNLCLSFGTTATINAQNEKYVELRPLWPPFQSAIPRQYYTEVAVLRGAWMITWFKEEFGLQERLEAMQTQSSPEELLEKLIKDVPPGSMGLVLQPYWTPTPGIDACTKGAIIGFGDVHTRAYLYRAILEGLVFAMKEGAQTTAKKNKTPTGKITVSGGGSQSDVIVQMVADIFGLSAHRPHTPETSALGAAIDAAVGLHFFPDFPTAVKQMTRAGKIVEPIPENRQLYQDLFDRVYTKMYRRLLPLYREIQKITQYPH